MDNPKINNTENCGMSMGAGGNATAKKIKVTINPSAPGTSKATSKDPFRYNIPYPTPHFKGRRDTMEAVNNYFIKLPLQPEDCWDRIVAIVGLDGMGKTETACKFAADFKDTFPNVAWINAETEKSALASFFGLAKHLKIVSNDRKEADLDLVKEVYLHLDQEDNGRVLFIFDNAVRLHSDETEFGIMEYLPTDDLPNQRFPYVLITTQTQDWKRRIEIFQVDKLTEVESLEFFRSCFAIESDECDDLFKELHELLEGYPLVMNLAASQIDYYDPRRDSVHQLKQQIHNYIHKLKRENTKILTVEFNCIWPTKYKKTLSNVWQLRFERIQQEENGSDALGLLQLTSFLHVPIKSYDVVNMMARSSDCPHPPKKELQFRLKELIRILGRFDTLRILEVRWDNEDGFNCDLGMTRMVQLVARQLMDSSKVLESILFYLANGYKDTKAAVNETALEEALNRSRLTQRALPYVGILACHGLPAAISLVKTQQPETKAAASIWRLYSLERGMTTLNENAIHVLRELIGLTKSEERLMDRQYFAHITILAFLDREAFKHKRNDGTEVPGYFNLTTFDGVEELVTQLLSNVRSLTGSLCDSDVCDEIRDYLDEKVTALSSKFPELQADASQADAPMANASESTEVKSQASQSAVLKPQTSQSAALKPQASQTAAIKHQASQSAALKPHASQSASPELPPRLVSPVTDTTIQETGRSSQTFEVTATSFEKRDTVGSALDLFLKNFKVTRTPPFLILQQLPQAIAFRQPPGTSTVIRAPPLGFEVPPPTRHFTGRRKTMEDIRNYFKTLPPRAIDCWERIVVIVGQGGIGKTEIASKFAADNKTTFPNAVWVNAETEHGTLKSFLQLAKDLGIVDQDRKSADLSLVAKIYRHMDRHDNGNFLLIFDNAILLQSEGTQSGIYDYLPLEDLSNQRFPHIIITTQATEWIREFKSIQVGPLAENESLEFFRRLFKIVSPVCDGVFKKLHELLQGHPLLVNLAASQIHHDPNKDSVYQLQQHINRFIERVKNEQNGTLGDKMNPTRTALDNKLLSILCQMAFQRLQQEDNGPEALELLQILSFLNLPIRSVDVKTILVCSTECPHLPDLELESRLQKLIQLLERFSIARILKRGRREELCEVGLNELVQSVVRQTTDCTKALERVLSYLTYGPYWKDVVNTSALEEGLPITQLSSHTLPYVGILACDGIRAASQIVETREPETKTAATIWRLYHLERGTTLNEDAVQVLGELVELTQSPVQLKHRHLFAQIAMLMLLDAEASKHVGDDDTTVSQYFRLTTFDGIEELVARLICNVCSFDGSLCESEVCGLRREDLDENVAAIAAKLSKTFINVNGPKQPSAVQLLADTWLAVLAMLKYYNLDTQNGVPYFWTKFWLETHKTLNSLGVCEHVIVELRKRLWDHGLANELIKAFKSVRFASKVVSSYFKECFDVCLDGMTLEDDRVKEVIAAFTEMAAKTQLNIFDSNSNDAINFAIDVCSVYVRLLLLDPAPRSTVLLGYLSRCEALTWIQETGEDGMHRKIKIIHWCRICEKYRSAYFPQFIARYSSTEVQEIQQLVALCRRIMKIGKL